MDLKVTLTEEDVKNGVRRSVSKCAISVALQRHFPGRYIRVSLGGNHRAGKVVILKHTPEWSSYEDESGCLKLDLLPEDKIFSMQRMAAEWRSLLQLEGVLPQDAVAWARKFDSDDIKAEDVPFSFEIELLYDASNTNNSRVPVP